MIEEFNKITELKSTLDEKTKLREKENALSKPLLKDTHHIPMIYVWFCEISGYETGISTDLSTDEKYQFLFIIMCLYSPASILGNSLVRGVRGAVAKVFHYRHGSGVSNHLPKVATRYNTYKDFSSKVDSIYLEIKERLIEKGLLLG